MTDRADPLQALAPTMTRGGAWAIAMSASTTMASMALHAWLARVLGPTELAAYFLGSSLVAAFALIGLLGMERVAVRLIAGGLAVGRADAARGDLGRSFQVALLALTVTAVSLASPALGERLNVPALPLTGGLLAAVGFTLLTRGLVIYIAEAFRGLHDIKRATWLAGPAAPVLGILLLASAHLTGLVTLTASSTMFIQGCAAALALSVPALHLFRCVRAMPTPTQKRPYRAFLHLGTPLVMTALGGVIVQHADVWIIAAHASDRATAVYGAAARLVILVTTPLMIVNAVVPPIIAGLWERGERARLERALRGAATLAGLPASVVLLGMALFGSQILGYVFGAAFSAGATVLLILAVAHLVNVWSGSPGLVLIMTGNARNALVCTVTAGLFGVAVSLSLAPILGSEGVAIGMGGGLVLQNVTTWWIVRTKLHIRTHVSFRLLRHPLRAARAVLMAQQGRINH